MTMHPTTERNARVLNEILFGALRLACLDVLPVDSDGIAYERCIRFAFTNGVRR